MKYQKWKLKVNYEYLPSAAVFSSCTLEIYLPHAGPNSNRLLHWSHKITQPHWSANRKVTTVLWDKNQEKKTFHSADVSGSTPRTTINANVGWMYVKPYKPKLPYCAIQQSTLHCTKYNHIWVQIFVFDLLSLCLSLYFTLLVFFYIRSLT